MMDKFSIELTNNANINFYEMERELQQLREKLEDAIGRQESEKLKYQGLFNKHVEKNKTKLVLFKDNLSNELIADVEAHPAKVISYLN